ncbi:glutamine amidotransferase [Prosthecomicrobium sp. N25]|uniref:glutamine amidotransferase n=1 Tax=Prosthecomicrobium sp. N25 TaxID=3129254 RepID=UPI0030771177
MPRSRAKPAPLPRILVVLHQETSSPGRVGQLLTRRGYVLDIRRPRYGDPLPDTLADHAGVIVFGGPMSANDEDDFVRREIDWLAVPLAEEKPFFGICLGAQMLVRHLGGRVFQHDHGRVEIGYYPLDPTEAGRSLMSWPSHVYQWHREGFDLPSGATLLAAGRDFPNQAIRVGPAAYGIQFHPELTLAMMYRWTVRGAHRFELPGAQTHVHHFEGRHLYDSQTRLWLERFLDLWLSGETTAAAAPSNRSGPRRLEHV